MKLALILISALGALHYSTSAPSAVVESLVYENLLTKPDTAVIISFRGKPVEEIVAEYENKYSVQERIADFEVLPNALQANADESQFRVLSVLNTKNVEYHQLWMTNQLVIENPTRATIDLLKHFPEVASIEADRFVPRIHPTSVESHAGPGPLQGDAQWGVKDVGAPEVWEAEVNGKGVVVGIVDTGALKDHEILSSNWRSEYGWLDVVGRRAEPYDDDGHGTHVTGTIAGANGYGVAPGAQWIACKGLGRSGGTNSGLQRCLQFMYCPTDPQGRNRDCTKRAKVVNNSWGGGNDRSFDRQLNTMQSNGMIMIFANGNEGRKGCGTVGSPADYEATIGVGAIDRNNRVTSFSSRGPARSGAVKPEISAPGANIVSASNRGTDKYVALQGTSMAAPHVAGVAALYAEKKPEMTHSEFKKAITGAAKAIKTTGESCGSTRDSQKPNNIFGFGKIYAPALLE